MIVIKAFARIQSSLGRVLELFVVQISLATLPLKLTIILSSYYTMWDSVIKYIRSGKTGLSVHRPGSELSCLRNWKR